MHQLINYWAGPYNFAERLTQAASLFNVPETVSETIGKLSDLTSFRFNGLMRESHLSHSQLFCVSPALRVYFDEADGDHALALGRVAVKVMPRAR